MCSKRPSAAQMQAVDVDTICQQFAENRMTLWCTVAKLWCQTLCRFSGPPCNTRLSLNRLIGWNVINLISCIKSFSNLYQNKKLVFLRTCITYKVFVGHPPGVLRKPNLDRNHDIWPSELRTSPTATPALGTFTSILVCSLEAFFLFFFETGRWAKSVMWPIGIAAE